MAFLHAVQQVSDARTARGEKKIVIIIKKYGSHEYFVQVQLLLLLL